jgi:hypothetical protein
LISRSSPVRIIGAESVFFWMLAIIVAT